MTVKFMSGEVNLDINTSTSLWALHNPLKPWTLYNLSETQLKLIIKSLSESELRLVKICKKNDAVWKSLDKKEHEDLFDNKTIEAYCAGEGYPSIETRGESVNDTEYFIIRPNKVLHPRMHQRFDVAVPCVVLGNNHKEFATETIDISEGGLQFKDVIPNWVSGYFLVIVKSKFQLMCSLVEDQKEKKRVQIVSEESDAHFIDYKNWLNTF